MDLKLSLILPLQGSRVHSGALLLLTADACDAPLTMKLLIGGKPVGIDWSGVWRVSCVVCRVAKNGRPAYRCQAFYAGRLDFFQVEKPSGQYLFCKIEGRLIL